MFDLERFLFSWDVECFQHPNIGRSVSFLIFFIIWTFSSFYFVWLQPCLFVLNYLKYWKKWNFSLTFFFELIAMFFSVLFIFLHCILTFLFLLWIFSISVEIFMVIRIFFIFFADVWECVGKIWSRSQVRAFWWETWEDSWEDISKVFEKPFLFFVLFFQFDVLKNLCCFLCFWIFIFFCFFFWRNSVILFFWRNSDGFVGVQHFRSKWGRTSSVWCSWWFCEE